MTLQAKYSTQPNLSWDYINVKIYMCCLSTACKCCRPSISKFVHWLAYTCSKAGVREKRWQPSTVITDRLLLGSCKPMPVFFSHLFYFLSLAIVILDHSIYYLWVMIYYYTSLYKIIYIFFGLPRILGWCII